MFIKIVNEEKYARDTLIDCDRYSMWEMKKDNDNSVPKVMVEIRGRTDMDYEVIKDGNTVVYILNNMGKTIDSFRWPKVGKLA